MKVKVTIEQDIPNSLYCTKQRGNCNRVETDKNNLRWCSLYNAYLATAEDGKLIKCSRCLNDLRYALGGKY